MIKLIGVFFASFCLTLLILFTYSNLNSSISWTTVPKKPFDVQKQQQLSKWRVSDMSRHIVLEAGDDLQYRLQSAVISAQAGSIIVLPQGKYAFNNEIVITQKHITILGQGIQKTVLDFSHQVTGAQGILALGDGFSIQAVSIENPPGDGIKTEGIDGFYANKIQVKWSGKPEMTNGGYGLYPVKSKNILIENSMVSGASDAGIYVGQSSNIILRYNSAEFNVAGINIENSKYVDIYNNWLAYNTAGVLVFNLPHLGPSYGYSTRIFNNVIFDNNADNFSTPGNLVNLVPSGTGIMVLANDKTEIFSNLIRKHHYISVLVSDYILSDSMIYQDGFDAFADDIAIYKNTIQHAPIKKHASDKDSLLPSILTGMRLDGVFSHSEAFRLLIDAHFENALPDILLTKFTRNIKEDKARACIYKNTKNNARLFDKVTKKQLNIDIDSNAENLDEMISVANIALSFQCQSRTPLQPVNIPDHSMKIAKRIDSRSKVDEGSLSASALCNKKTLGVNWNAFVVNCPRLSDYNLFVDLRNPTENAQVGGIKYDISTPLFSDYTYKHRFVFIPPGQSATYTASGVFDFPVGSIVVKTFQSPVTMQMLETRLLIRKETGWHALPYIWENGQAVLAIGGGSKAIHWNANNSDAVTQYSIPNANQCANCHLQNNKLMPIGLKAKWLNRSYQYAEGLENQLQHWSDTDMLVGLPNDKHFIPAEPIWSDPRVDLAQRAKAYLDINCAHCHNPAGQARSTKLNLTANQALDSMYGLCKPSVAAGPGSGGLRYGIVPGKPEESILLYRMASVQPAVKMPELGRSVVHQEAVTLITAWIKSMEGRCVAPYKIAL